LPLWYLQNLLDAGYIPKTHHVHQTVLLSLGQFHFWWNISPQGIARLVVNASALTFLLTKGKT
jgi:hypothetical protein